MSSLSHRLATTFTPTTRGRARRTAAALISSSSSPCSTGSVFTMCCPPPRRLLVVQAPRRPRILATQEQLPCQYQTASSLWTLQNTTNKSNKNICASQKMLARIPPMKRILCLCPVPAPFPSPEEHCELETRRSTNKNNNGIHYEKYWLGMAVSDPYLAYAIPIRQRQHQTMYDQEVGEDHDVDISSFYVGTTSDNLLLGSMNNLNNRNETLPLASCKGFPKTMQELMDRSGYMDIGAIVLGLPMVDTGLLVDNASISQRNEKMELVQSAVFSLLNNLLAESRQDDKSTTIRNSSPKKERSVLQCFQLEEERMTLQDARKMAREEPEMWEEIQLDDHDDRDDEHQSSIPLTPPEIHASVVLNDFLWKHTGGWRNTFA